MDFLSQITWIDLLVVLILALGALAGWTQGIARLLLGCVAVIVSFVLASLLKRSLTDLLSGMWLIGTPAFRELLVFLFLFAIILVGLWFAIRAAMGASGLQLPRAVDEIGGALLGVVFGAMVIVFVLLAMDSFYRTAEPLEARGWRELQTFYLALNDSPLVQALRAAIVPTAGVLARPFVPEDVRQVLQRA